MIDSMYTIKYDRGLKFLSGNNITLAILELQGAVNLKVNEIDGLNLLGLCYYRTGDFKKSKALWFKSTQVDNSQANRAFEYLSALDKDDFREFLNLYNRGIEYLKKKQYKECSSCILKCPINDMGITLPFNILGLCSYAEGKKSDALKYWTKSLEFDRGNEDVLNYITSLGEIKALSFRPIQFMKNLFNK